jgi:hypothetical protein
MLPWWMSLPISNIALIPEEVAVGVRLAVELEDFAKQMDQRLGAFLEAHDRDVGFVALVLGPGE